MDPMITKAHVEAWRSLRQAHAVATESVSREMEQAGQLPLDWYDVLLVMYESSGKKLKMTEVARVAHLTKSGATRLVDRMQRAGLVQRHDAARDKRSTFAALTEHGAARLKSAWTAYRDATWNHFGSRLSESEAEQLATLLAKVSA